MKIGTKLALLAGLAVVGALIGAELFRGATAATPPATTAAANIKARDTSGKEWSLADFKGKPVIVSFFATWCGPCMMEMPHLEELQRKHKSRGLEVAVITQEGLKEVKALGMDKAPFRVLINGDAAFTRYNISAIPRLFYFGPEGSVVHQLEGFDEAGLREIDERIGQLPTATAAAFGTSRVARIAG